MSVVLCVSVDVLHCVQLFRIIFLLQEAVESAGLSLGLCALARVVHMSDVRCAFHHVLRVTSEQKEGKVNDGHQDFAYMQVNGHIV